MTWSAAQYTKFEDERTRPVRDLLAAVPTRTAARVVDVGCGPGNSTECLRERYPEAEVTGLDSSPDMVAAARARLPDLRFALADVAAWARTQGDPLDVILANAVLQWVPDHAALMPALVARLAPGGSLAVQVPDNLDEPAHRLMREVAAAGPWAARLAGAAGARAERHDPAWYDRALAPRGRDGRRLAHGLPPPAWRAAPVPWSSGSSDGPAPLPRAPRGGRAGGLPRALRGGAADAYPAEADGAVLLPFPRLFVVATR